MGYIRKVCVLCEHLSARRLLSCGLVSASLVFFRSRGHVRKSDLRATFKHIRSWFYHVKIRTCGTKPIHRLNFSLSPLYFWEHGSAASNHVKSRNCIEAKEHFYIGTLSSVFCSHVEMP
ncbi:hypothetical protein BDZ89DRAFT_822909 [Hymenopellis radicata]|nr:hypothetical protein BDZ89DRAFT_822909 [Hymenopellis radicata]